MGGMNNKMYLSEENIEREALRQGDIITGAQIVGAISLKEIICQNDASGKTIAWVIPRDPCFAASIILSHSCEIERSNGVKMTSITKRY